MDDLTIAEKWLAGMLGVGAMVAGWANRAAKQSSRDDAMTARIAAVEKDVVTLRQNLQEIQAELHEMRTEQQADVKALWDRTEERHNRLDGKIDRLLERGNGK